MTTPPLTWHEIGSQPAKPNHIQATLNNGRPKVFLPSDDRPMSVVAAELGEHLADRLYVHAGEIVMLDGNALRKVDTQTFRTLAEESVVCCRQRTSGHSVVQVDATMTADESRGILKAPQFRGRLRPITRVNTVRLPTIRNGGRIELLPDGYDEGTQTLTVCAVTYPDNVPFADGVRTIRDLFSEFEFADGERSLAVAVAGLVGLYAAQLVPLGELRPAFTYQKNAEGAGATTDSPLGGEIEVDESYFGGHRKGRRGCGATGKTPVFGLLKRGGKVYARVIPDVKSRPLKTILERKIVPDSIVYSDTLSSYNVLDIAAFHHLRINHSKLFSENKNHINGIENFWNQAKRHLRRFNGIPKQNFHLFLSEC